VDEDWTGTPPGKPPAPPRGLATAGRRLWRSVVSVYELDEHEALVLLQACRTADVLDRLAGEVTAAPSTITNRFGELVAHPLLGESRQQAITLARLLAALRLPDAEAGASRPQRRRVRGAYGVRSVS